MAAPACQYCSQSPAYCCNCQRPAVLCCTACSDIHQSSPGEHQWARFQRSDRWNSSCGVCQNRLAEVLCCCSFPVVYLCQQCKGEHTSKGDLRMHLVQLIEKDPLITSLEVIERARRVLENRDRIEAFLSANKTAAEKFKDEVICFAEREIVRINCAKDATLKPISEFGAEVERKLITLNQVIGNHLFDREVQSSDPLIREAFDTSKRFNCFETLQGDLCSIGEIGPVLAQLRLPSFFQGVDSLNYGFQQPDSHFFRGDYGYQQVAAGASPPDLTQQLPQLLPQGFANPYTNAPQNLYHSSPLMEYVQVGRYVPEEYSRYPPVTPPASSLEEGSLQSAYVSYFIITWKEVYRVHAPCQDNFQANTHEMPYTIGRHRLPIGSLIEEYRWSLQQLPERYSSWRRSREDGNSFYRCVGTLLCEHYCRPDTPLQELKSTYKLMRRLEPPFQPRRDLGYVKLWLRMLKDLYYTRKKGENALQKLQYLLQRQECDRAVVTAVRQYTANYCQLHANDPQVCVFLTEDLDSIIGEILSFGKEAEGIAPMFTVKVLNIVLHVHVHNTTSGQVPRHTYGPSAKSTYPAMHLLHTLEHYCILTPREWDAADRYDFTSNAYSPVATNQPVDYEEYSPT